jgi:Cu(I)/Ag(I) efflux system membrane fusion protein
MKTILSILALAILAIAPLTIVGCKRSASETTTEKATAKFFCPMHPTYTSDRQGDCPICNMKLVPIKRNEAGDTSSEASAMVPGRIAIQITPEKQQMIGVRFALVEERELSRSIRTTGTVQHDETRLAKITPRFGGFVRKLTVNFTGQEVKKGEPLFTVYSPELFSTEREYLLALHNLKRLGESAVNEQKESAQRLLDAARRRLELWQISDEEIRALEESGKAREEVVFRSPVSGHVVSKTAVEGKAFMAGETLYEIADLTELWIRAVVYEYELPDIRVGQKARATFSNVSSNVYESEVTFIYPHIDPQSRRAEIRLNLHNPKHELKPDMWATIELQVELGKALTIPASSIIDTGTRNVAFVEGENHHLEPREVKVGARTDDYIQVIDGLKAGEKVVTRALFLVESESQLKAAVAGMGAAGEHKH